MALFAGERALIARIRGQAAIASGDLSLGIGDDCAAYRSAPGRLGLATCDTLVEGVHFDCSWHPPTELGRKAASVNLSDIAAMGGIPRFALLSLALPGATDEQWLEQFMAGFLAALSEHNTVLVGGDTVRSGREKVFSVTLLGEVEGERMLSRKGARPGDLVLVGGSLGMAAAGLALCRRGLDRDEVWRPLLAAHLDPTPQLALGRLLGQSGLVHAMLDLSDGLATDLAHICAESGVGALVEAASLPIDPLTEQAAALCGESALDWALSGGEDYRLLFAVAPENLEAVQALAVGTGERLTVVGEILAGTGIVLKDGDAERQIAYQGYEHFA